MNAQIFNRPTARSAILCLCLGACLLAGSPAAARVTGLEILESEAPAFGGTEFGAVGAYERIVARVDYAVDPAAPSNAGVVDLDRAARNADGAVEFSAEMVLLRPVEASKGNGGLFYEVANRGRNLSFPLINDGPFAPNPTAAEHAGNGFLMAEGYAIVWSGWQWRLKDEYVELTVPVAQGTRGVSREEFVFDNDEPVSRRELTYPAADLDASRATLTVRTREADPRATPAGLAFTYLSATEVEITRPAGVPAGAVYELVYPVKDSLVAGLGFVAVRDLVSLLRGSPGHGVASPLGEVGFTVGIGISQAGRFMRDFVHQGFNADETGAQVFDGMIAHIAGSRKTFTNYRFAQPGRYSRQHEDHAFPGDQFPFTYVSTHDPLTDRTDGVLNVCRGTGTCPKVMHTDTGTEFWQARASLLVTDARGRALDMPDDVRLYSFAGTQHYTIAGSAPAARKACVFPNNPAHIGTVMRALVSSMRAWVTDGVAPPASRFPNLRDATLVAPEKLGMPALPGLASAATINRLNVLDHAKTPPAAGPAYPVFVPAVDADGNERAGIRLPHVAVPLATHTGWNLRKAGYAEGELCSLNGSHMAFPQTVAQASANNDPRRPVEQRYENEQAYLAAVRAAASALAADRLILAQDVEVLVRRAQQAWAIR